MLIQIQPSSDAVEVLGHERRTDVRTIGTLTRVSSLARVSCLTLLTRTSARWCVTARGVFARTAGELIVLACGWAASRVKGLRWRLSRVRAE